ncbi:hypothetical protein ACFL54_09545, partial [Planctomycetota bacterium]
EVKVEGVSEDDKELFTQVFEQSPEVPKQFSTENNSFIFRLLKVKDPLISDMGEEKLKSGMARSRYFNLLANIGKVRELVYMHSGATLYGQKEEESISGTN